MMKLFFFFLFSLLEFLVLSQDTINVTELFKLNKKLKDASIHLGKGVFSIDDDIVFENNNLRIQGESADETKLICKSKSKASIFTINSIHFKISNLTIDGNYDEYNVGLIQIGKNKAVSSCTVENVIVKNIKGKKKGVKNHYGIVIHMNNTKNVLIENSSFFNISAYNTDNKEGEGDGFCGGIFLFSSIPLNNSNTYNVKIKSCTFDNIYTENPETNGWDSDGIRFFSGASFEELQTKNNLIIKKCTFNKIQKSAIKISGAVGVKIIKNFIFSDSIMLCPIRVQWAKNVIIKGNFYSGKFLYGINIIGKDVEVKSNYISEEFEAIRKLVSIQEVKNVKNENIKTSNKSFKRKSN